jgi:hypothetical protein
VPLADVLSGLRVLFLEKPASRADWDAHLRRRAPGLSDAERRALLAVEEDRLDVYVSLLREGQATMLGFVAPSTASAIERFAGVTPSEWSRRMLIETPRRTSRLRELAARVVEHLEGPAAPWVAACPPLLDLARLERETTECFYAPDDEGALSPPAFADSVSAKTLEDVLAMRSRPSATVRRLEVEHDVLAWRDAHAETGTWPDPPPRLARPATLVGARDPGTLQCAWHRLDERLLPLLDPARVPGGETLESLAGAWVEAAGVDPEDPTAPGRFLEFVAGWVRHGLLAVS